MRHQTQARRLTNQLLVFLTEVFQRMLIFYHTERREMIKLVIDCERCDKTISSVDEHRPDALILNAMARGWTMHGAYGHLCPACSESMSAAISEPDAALARAAADWSERPVNSEIG